MKNRIRNLLRFKPVRVVYGMLAAIVIKLPRIAFFMLSFFAIFWVSQQLYYKYSPADQFLDYYYAKVDDSVVGTPPIITLCRRVSTEGIKIDAVRTFIQYVGENKTEQVVGEYQFKAGVEKADTNCQNLRLQNQPMREGTYKVHTEYVFYINGNRKAGSYDSNQYKMLPQTLTITEQIQQLQDEINKLNAEIDALKARQTAGDNDTSAVTPGPNTGSSSGSTSKPSSTTPAAGNNGNASNNGNQGNSGNPAPVVPPARCIVPILGGGLLCGSDGTIRL